LTIPLNQYLVELILRRRYYQSKRPIRCILIKPIVFDILNLNSYTSLIDCRYMEVTMRVTIGSSDNELLLQIWRRFELQSFPTVMQVGRAIVYLRSDLDFSRLAEFCAENGVVPYTTSEDRALAS
jgi:hypothetical protein